MLWTPCALGKFDGLLRQSSIKRRREVSFISLASGGRVLALDVHLRLLQTMSHHTDISVG